MYIVSKVTLNTPGKGHQPLSVFNFLIWILNFWKDFKVLSHFIPSYKNASNPPICWDHGLYSHKLQSFPPNRSSKMRESQHLPCGLRLVRRICEETLTPRNPNQNTATLRWIFHQIIVRQPIRRTGSIQTVIRTSRRLDSFLYEAAQKFEVFSKIQKWN